MTATGYHATIKKDPAALRDYGFDWSDYLDDLSDTISSSMWSADTGITIASTSNTTTTALVWLSGGTAGSQYRVVNTITTTGGRTDQRTLLINCVER